MNSLFLVKTLSTCGKEKRKQHKHRPYSNLRHKNGRGNLTNACQLVSLNDIDGRDERSQGRRRSITEPAKPSEANATDSCKQFFHTPKGRRKQRCPSEFCRENRPPDQASRTDPENRPRATVFGRDARRTEGANNQSRNRSRPPTRQPPISRNHISRNHIYRLLRCRRSCSMRSTSACSLPSVSTFFSMVRTACMTVV